MKTPENIIDAIKNSVGPKGWTDNADKIEAHITEWRGIWRGSCDLVVSPATTSEVSSIVKICNDASIPITPQGGNTGLVGAGVPDGGIVLCLSRMNQIRKIDIDNNTMIVEAGCVLSDIQIAANKVNRLFPLSLGAESTCQIGGNISTNAGGVQVLHYGNARDLVLGLEIILPDGRIWDGLRSLRKNNTGYDLKHLFIGAEGTLGVITAAVLKLFPSPKYSGTAMTAMDSPEKALKLMQNVEVEAGECFTGFELLNKASMELAINYSVDVNYPFKTMHKWYALIDLTGSIETNQALENILSKALEQNIINEGVIAASRAQANNLWKIREAVPNNQSAIGASIKHDISVPVSKVPKFLNLAKKIIEKKLPGVSIIAFGHLGDGNIHFNLSQPKLMATDTFLAQRKSLNHLIYEIVDKLDGSFSAEHGIGILKREEMNIYCLKTELELMRKLKAAIDPNETMNPQKLLKSK
jgi:FAD/FMN-containing dehydrogenase